MPTREMPGASLFNVSSIFPKIENSMSENPVTLRPGRARLSTAPDAIGSLVTATTIGIERVQFRQDRNDTITDDNNDVGIQRDEIRGIGPHQIQVARGPMFVELNIAALGPSQPCQFLPESPNVGLRSRITFREGHQDANPPHLTGLLPPRRERPSGVAPPTSVMNSRRLIGTLPRRGSNPIISWDENCVVQRRTMGRPMPVLGLGRVKTFQHRVRPL